MSNAVSNLIQKVKSSCDNDTMMFYFPGDSIASAYDRQLLHTQWVTPSNEYFYDYVEVDVIGDDGQPTGEKQLKEIVTNSDAGSIDENGNYIVGSGELTFFRKVIMPRMVKEPCVRIYYKNQNGVWVDYLRCLTLYANLSILVSSVLYEENVKVDINILPKCIYTDADRYIHNIDEHDGLDNDLGLPGIEVDTNDNTVVKAMPFDIDQPNLPRTAALVMNDLKIEVPEQYTSSDFLLWLNGAFVPTMQDNTYRNVMYVENAMTMIDTKVVNQKIGSIALPTGSGATVKLDESNNEYRYDIRLKFFGWKNVKVSPWYRPLETTTVPITHNYKSVYIIKTIVFPEEINENAHFIMVNGIVLNPSDYVIDPNDKRKITLLKVEQEANALLKSILDDIAYDRKNGTSYYQNVKPLNLIQEALTSKYYSLVNFSTTEKDKTLYMKRSTCCATNFPYYREITFPKIESGDMVLINGTYNRFEWIHDNTIYYPKFTYSYNEEESNIKPSEVERIYFISK